MKDYIKNYWYVALISVIFIIGIIAVVVSSQQGVVSGKKVDGKDIVYSIGETHVTADEVYDQVKERFEAPLAAMIFEREVISRTYEFDEDQKVEAKLEADQLLAYYKSQLGEDKAEVIVNQLLQSMGYPKDSGLVEYFLNNNASQKLVNDYFETNYKEKFLTEQQPSIMSHILVQAPEDPNMSDEDKEKAVNEKKAEIDELLKTEEFSKVATEHSADPGSAQRGGSLGLVYKSINFHDEFKDAAFKLKPNEVSDWVESPSGWHKIVITSNVFADIQADQTYKQVIDQLYPHIKGEALFKQAETLKFDFSENPEFEKQLRAVYQLGE